MKVEETLFEGAIGAALTLITDNAIRKVMKGTDRNISVAIGEVTAVATKKYAMEKGWIKPIA